MPIQLLIGPVYTLDSALIYAMPARSVLGYTSTSLLEANLVNSTTGMTALTVTGLNFQSAAPFIRTTAATAVIRLCAL